MKINTSELYKSMTSAEKARIYQMTTDQVEREKIRASIPRLTYSALDYEFTNRVSRQDFEQLTLMIDWFKTLLWLTENYHSWQELSSDVHKQAANTCISKLAALEEEIDPNHKELLALIGNNISVEGYAMVYGLEVQPELVEQFTQQLQETREQVIDEMYF